MSSITELLSKAAALHEAGNLVEAEAAYRAITAQYAESSEAWIRLGDVLSDSSNPINLPNVMPA